MSSPKIIFLPGNGGCTTQDDPWIPVKEARFLHEQIGCEYHEFTNQGHFGGDYMKPTFPELTLSILNNLQARR